MLWARYYFFILKKYTFFVNFPLVCCKHFIWYFILHNFCRNAGVLNSLFSSYEITIRNVPKKLIASVNKTQTTLLILCFKRYVTICSRYVLNLNESLWIYLKWSCCTFTQNWPINCHSVDCPIAAIVQNPNK